jgi:hypothetical protein
MTNPNAVDGTASVMRTLAAAFVSWLITGALGTTDWQTRDLFFLIMVCTALGTIQLILLLALFSSAGELWPRSAGAYATSAILGFGATAVWAILGSAWACHPFIGLFCSLAGVYLGLAVEGVTGVSGRVGARWAATAALEEGGSGAVVARARRD